MLAASLPIDVWFGVAFIAAITVLSCLGVISALLRHELEFIRVVAGAKRLRDKLTQPLDKPVAQHGKEAIPANGRPGMIGSSSPIPTRTDAAETEAIIEIPPDEPELEPASESEPDTESAATDAAQAA